MAKYSGEALIEVLRHELECKNNNQLAKKLGVLAPQIAAWERSKLTRAVFRNIIRKLETRLVSNSFEAICEFRQLSPHQEGTANSLRNRINSVELCEKLGRSQGIYAYYDSSGKLIYVGKTEKNHLLGEMGQQFSKRKVAIKRTNGNGEFVRTQVPLREFVEYCSAYRVHKSVIANFEALIARLAPNDIFNSQIPRYR